MDERNNNNCPLCRQEFYTKKSKRVAEEQLTSGILKIYAERQILETLPCPMCGEKMDSNIYHNASCRLVKGLYVCSDCGMLQAIMAFEFRECSVLSYFIISEIIKDD
jgi:predicted RNA-binding Zn-ribbon protein involved in translation (DUF1610 family)